MTVNDRQLGHAEGTPVRNGAPSDPWAHDAY